MAEVVNTFEGGSDETALTTGNTGGASGDAFDYVHTVGTQNFDTAVAAHGTLSGRFSNTATDNSSSYARWSTAIGTTTTNYGRVYLYLSSWPATDQIVIGRFLNSTTHAAFFSITSAGKIRLRDANYEGVQSTGTVATGQWIRLEYKLVNSTTVGSLDVRYYATADSETITETVSTDTSRDTEAQTTTYRFGCILADSSSTVWIDDLVAGATDWPGPAAALPIELAGTIAGTSTTSTGLPAKPDTETDGTSTVFGDADTIVYLVALTVPAP